MRQIYFLFSFFIFTLFFQILDINTSLIILLPLPYGVLLPSAPNSFSLSSCLKFSVHCGFKLCNNHLIHWFISFEAAKRVWKFIVSFRELPILLSSVEEGYQSS